MQVINSIFSKGNFICGKRNSLTLIIYVNSMVVRILEDSNDTLLVPLTELAETKTKAKLLPIGL